MSNIKNSQLFSLAPFLTLDLVIQKDIILYLLEQQKLNKKFGVIESVVKGLGNSLKPNLSWCLNLGFTFIKSYQQFGLTLFDPSSLAKDNKQPKHLLAASSCLPCLETFASLSQKISYDDKNISLPLMVRQKKTGDILKFSFGTQKLKTFLINQKVPISQRNYLWLVVDACDNILWIPHLYINKVLGKKDLVYLGLKHRNCLNFSS